ncbi:MAG: hypothetical protein ACRD6N_03080, partial [Pyrinomonadaceae bacterium]
LAMGLTGLMIWLKLGFFSFLPRWTIDVALAIHFYEALLATLAIVVWHFYHVIFDPDVYPINWASMMAGCLKSSIGKNTHLHTSRTGKLRPLRLPKLSAGQSLPRLKLQLINKSHLPGRVDLSTTLIVSSSNTENYE